MSIFAVNGVRLDERTGRVTHVRWAQVNPKQNQWVSEPAEAPVIDVVDAIVAGDQVWTIFPEGVNTVLGPQLKSVVYAGGLEGIDTVDPKQVNRTLRDLPRI
jgi:hypothetical protein